jgi:hypothetical protein
LGVQAPSENFHALWKSRLACILSPALALVGPEPGSYCLWQCRGALQIELRETELDVLARKGLLETDARDDPNAVRRALHAHLDRTLGSMP